MHARPRVLDTGGTARRETQHRRQQVPRVQTFAPGNRPGRCQLGRIGPLALVLWIGADTALRFAPSEWLNLRPVLVAVRFPRPHAPFEPNLRIHTERFVGEAALDGNLPTQEQRPPIRFSTNALGFRLNPHIAEQASPEIVVWRGASFAYGASLSDEETFAAQLTQVSGLRSFNSGRFHLDRDGLPELDWLLSKLDSKPKTAVFLHLEQAGLPPARTKALVSAGGMSIPDPRQDLRFRYAARVLETWQRMSPLEILSTRFFKSISNDRILPNPYRHNVQPMELPDGSTLLMRRYEIEAAKRPGNGEHPRNTAASLTALCKELRKRGMETVVVVLLPTRLTVYSPWLKDSAGKEAPSAAYLKELEAELAARKVTTVNGLEVFRQQIEHEMSTGQLSFYRDDNHWNPQGVRRIAQAVAQLLPERSIQESAHTSHAVQ
jgi:hypothetical protein